MRERKRRRKRSVDSLARRKIFVCISHKNHFFKESNELQMVLFAKRHSFCPNVKMQTFYPNLI